jgi:AraC-like DNA-binding protein
LRPRGGRATLGARMTGRWGIPAYIHLLRAKDRIDRCYAEPLDVATLARTALASEAHFNRSFKQAFGETPHRYLQRRRIERAADLLRETDTPVTEVCAAVGFQSLGSFSTAFRDLMGASPSAYRDARRGAPPPQVPACFTLMWTRPVGRAVLEKRAAGGGASVGPDHDQEGRTR